MTDQYNHQLVHSDEIDLLDYWWVIWKYKGLIGIVCAISVATALFFSLLSPKVYESTATILIPREAGGGLLSALAASGLAQQIGISVPSLAPNRDLFVNILKSRLLAKAVVERFNLKQRYGFRTLEEAIEAAVAIPQVTQKEALLEVKVEDTDPQLAAEIANFCVEQLDRLVTQYGTTAASRQRQFITEQIARTEKDLKSDEEVLTEFQQRNRAFLLGDMANSMKLPGAQIPKVGMELNRLSRGLKVHETVYTLLTQQLENVKIAEAQDTPIVQLLDRAVPATRISKPKTWRTMLLAGGISLFLGIFLAFFLEHIQRQKQQA